MRALLLPACLALALASSTALAASRPVVVELFTSEGCSSCPPAEELLTALAGRPDVLPLAFHITYWNSLGWRDPFSFEGATDRQAAYAERLGGGRYTPEMVIEGRRGMVGSEVGEVAAAIMSARDAAASAVRVSLTRSEGAVAISIGASPAGAGKGDGSVLLIGFDPRHETHIGRGENSGRTLIESNVVRSIRKVGDYTGTATRMWAPLGAGAEVAVIVQAPDGRILGAGRVDRDGAPESRTPRNDAIPIRSPL